jgi:hypothetical protein
MPFMLSVWVYDNFDLLHNSDSDRCALSEALMTYSTCQELAVSIAFSFLV